MSSLRYLLGLGLAVASLHVHCAEFATESFRITLPGAWHDASAPDVITYESSTGSEQVVVGEYKLKIAMPVQDLRPILEEFVEIRRSAEDQLFQGRAFIGRAFYSVGKEQIRAEYWGEHAPTGHQFVTVVFATSARLLSFRYESREGPTEFRAKADSVLSGIRLVPEAR